MPDKPSNTLHLVFMYYVWHNFLICPFQIKPTIFVLIPVSFRLISVYSGVIPARSCTFRYHSYPLRFIPASFCLVPVYSGLFRYIPFRSLPFLCLVAPFSHPMLQMSHWNPTNNLRISFDYMITTRNMICE